MRVRIDSIGCRLNIGEAEQLARALASEGHRIVGPGDDADLMVLNTCAVTHIAARKSRKLIRHWRRAHPKVAIVVTGCYAELSRREAEGLGVDLVVGNLDKDELPRLLARAGLLRDALPVPPRDAGPLELDGGGTTHRNGAGHTRAFVKVQDGCDNRCTFCIVTVARGDSRSRPAREIVAEIRGLVDAGYREAVLSGVHLGSYGHDQESDEGLSHLVRTILEQTAISRLRLSSLEPWDLAADFFSLWQADPRLLPHLHLPLQSGCDDTLRRMSRRTDQRSYRGLVAEARARIAEVSVTTDVMVGFPGETDEEFETSLAFVEEIGFAKLHVFRYSPREGTAAATMPGQVAPDTAQRRSQRMHALGAELETRFRSRLVGRTLPVLWESGEPLPGGLRWSGLTGNYQRVAAETAEGIDLENRVTDTELVGMVPGALVGVADPSGIREACSKPAG